MKRDNPLSGACAAFISGFRIVAWVSIFGLQRRPVGALSIQDAPNPKPNLAASEKSFVCLLAYRPMRRREKTPFALQMNMEGWHAVEVSTQYGVQYKMQISTCYCA